MRNESFDLIGDIHGEAAALRDLLARLGYREQRGSYRHPSRRVIFLGDYVDRGPAIRESLQIVRRMVEEGAAEALCGNHELDVLLHDTPDGRGGWLRGHRGYKSAMHARTHAEFADRAEEWAGWLAWIRERPLYLDLPGLRAVHAYWKSEHIRALGGHRTLDAELLPEVARRKSARGRAVHLLLKGPEVPLPDGRPLIDADGTARLEMRVRWWNDGRGRTYREAGIHQRVEGPDLPVSSAHDHSLTPPDLDDPRPLFIGHYWLPPQTPAPLTPKVACLDYSVAGGGPLVAYRWDGESELRADKFLYDARRLEDFAKLSSRGAAAK